MWRLWRGQETPPWERARGAKPRNARLYLIEIERADLGLYQPGPFAVQWHD